MGEQYSTILVGGSVPNYNTNAPADDGSQVEANRVKYATIKTDLGNPLDAGLKDMDSKLLAQTNEGPDTETAPVTLTTADHNKVLECSGTFTLKLPTPTSNKGFQCTVKNAGSGVITVEVATGENIDGSSSVPLGAGQAIKPYVNNAENAYIVASGKAAGSDFPATTAMVFYQDAAPLGWTIVQALDDHAITLTGGEDVGGSVTGGTAGGSNNFSAQFANHVEGAALGVADKILAEADIPAHNHDGGVHSHGFEFNATDGDSALNATRFFGARDSDLSLPAVSGGAGGSTNTVIIADSSATVVSYGGGGGHGHTLDLRVKWAACIVATKD